MELVLDTRKHVVPRTKATTMYNERAATNESPPGEGPRKLRHPQGPRHPQSTHQVPKATLAPPHVELGNERQTIHHRTTKRNGRSPPWSPGPPCWSSRAAAITPGTRENGSAEERKRRNGGVNRKRRKSNQHLSVRGDPRVSGPRESPRSLPEVRTESLSCSPPPAPLPVSFSRAQSPRLAGRAHSPKRVDMSVFLSLVVLSPVLCPLRPAPLGTADSSRATRIPRRSSLRRTHSPLLPRASPASRTRASSPTGLPFRSHCFPFVRYSLYLLSSRTRPRTLRAARAPIVSRPSRSFVSWGATSTIEDGPEHQARELDEASRVEERRHADPLVQQAAQHQQARHQHQMAAAVHAVPVARLLRGAVQFRWNRKATTSTTVYGFVAFKGSVA